MKHIALGSLPPFEYKMLRAALNYAVTFCGTTADCMEGGDPKSSESEQARYWRDQESEMRAIRARFSKAGRRGAK